MEYNLVDPNNHAPAVAEEDAWGDVESFDKTANAPTHLLPARRLPSGKNQIAEIGRPDDLLKGPRAKPLVLESEPSELEVREWNEEIVKLLVPEPVPEKIVAQKVFHKKEPGSRKVSFEPGEAGSPESISAIPLRHLVKIGVAITLLLAIAIAILPQINKEAAKRADASAIALIPETKRPVVGIAPYSDMLNYQEQATRIFETYAAAERFEEIMPLILEADKADVLLRERWQALAAPKAWKVPSNTTWKNRKVGSTLYGELNGVAADFSFFCAYFRVENQQLKLDLKATFAFSSASYEDLVIGKGNPSEIRGYLKTSDFYNQTWPENKYRSYNLISPSSEVAIWCYAQYNSKIPYEIDKEATLTNLEGVKRNQIKVTLRLKPGPAGSQPNQWEIAEFIQCDWSQP